MMKSFRYPHTDESGDKIPIMYYEQFRSAAKNDEGCIYGMKRRFSWW